MSISLLGGLAKGLTLKVPPGHTIRPMAAPLKRRLFDRLQNLAGVNFVDCCAGSGAVGLEAWSRGATQVWLNEFAKSVARLLAHNCSELEGRFPAELAKRPIYLSQADVRQFIKNWLATYSSWGRQERENTVLFFAPPYPDHQLYRDFLAALKSDGRFEGQLWVESDEQKGLSAQQIEALCYPALKRYSQGTAFVQIINF